MIVSPRTPLQTQACVDFLREHGVQIKYSEDLRLLARLNADMAICGVVAYNGFVGKVCTMHVAGDETRRWIDRQYLYLAFHYPFEVCKLNTIIAPVGAKNASALRLDRKLGFRDVYRIKNGWDENEDLILLEMKRIDCRWLEMKNAERFLQTSRLAA
jgi:hypothetical protein